MLSLDDKKWKEYTGATGVPYDAAPMLRSLIEKGANEDIWRHCWNHLVYQGDIGEVLYAAVPYLAAFIRESSVIDWNALALICAIELARPAGPELPSELAADYQQTIESMPLVLANHRQVVWDDLIARCAASCIALARGQRELGRVYFEMDLEAAIRWLASRDQ